MLPLIHPTAIISSKAELASDVKVGAYSLIGPQVNIDKGTEIKSHVVIEGDTTIGKNNRIFQFASLGAIPQDKKYHNEPTKLVIGDGNTIREYCTFNIGTVTGIGETQVGNDNWIMAYVHIAHDCVVGSHTILANNTTLAGHVVLKDWVLTGGYTLILQFCQIGEHAMTAFGTRVNKDVPPYVMEAGTKMKPAGINLEGLKRRGFSAEQIVHIKEAYKILYRQNRSFMSAKKEICLLANKYPELYVFKQFFDSMQCGIVR